MTQFFKGLALLVALTCLVWVGVLWRWQATQRDMSAADIVMYLVALPLALFAVVLVARWAFKGAAAKSALAASGAAAGAGAGASARAGGGATAAANAPATAGMSDEQRARHATWQLLAACLNTPLGASADEVMQAVEAGGPMPAADPELRDNKGLPAICARVPDLSCDALAEELAPLIEQAQARHPGLSTHEHLPRALALAETPLTEAVAALQPWAKALGGAPSAEGQPTQPLAGDKAPLVRLLVAWPAAFNALEVEVARLWLERPLREASDGVVHQRRWVMPPLALEAKAEARPDVGAAPPSLTGPQLWQQADHLFELMRREQRNDVVMLLAVHTDINTEAVQQLCEASQLFSGANSKGRVPGEACAVMVLAPATWPADPDSEAPKPHVHRAALMQRDKSIDSGGRLSHDHAPVLVEQALAAARLGSDEVAAICNDADLHSPRSAELFAATLGALPKLDPSEDMHMVGKLSGTLGACGTLLTVAMAAQWSRKNEKPCVALSVSDAQWRAVLVVRPDKPPPEVPEAPEAPAAATSGAPPAKAA